ncbi:formyltransferase family protein [bacterium]|jgi:methionyl-tRNA formyltransferase|nr:formyltransferase family protein [bacterium]|tara:strand:+ start:149 stop:787 length:639 start_codon:yes stop_codon:yes gene_type:complete
MKVVYYGYRDWSFKIFNNLNVTNKYLVTHKDYNIVNNIKPDLVFFVGWSDMIPKEIIDNNLCVCLHPSPLPKYRGGSPIQNQLLKNEKTSMVSLFIMDEGIDTGDILFQGKINLKGQLKDIFSEIVQQGSKGVNFIVDNFNEIPIIRNKQELSGGTFFNRLKPEDSELRLSDFENHGPEYFYNKIRGLDSPYPNAYIKCKNGEKLYILKTKY